LLVGDRQTIDLNRVSADIDTSAELIRAQARLVTAVQDLSLVRTVPAIQEIVRRAARDLVGADGATFVLREGDKCFYADEDAISPLWKGQRFPMAACVSGWAMLHARPAVIPDIYADDRIPADAYRPTFVKSLVMVPIRLKAPIGAIGVYWACPRAASDQEVALLQGLANTTSVAMENVQVYTELEQRVARRTQQLESLNSELEAFSYSVSHDLRAPLRAVNGFTDLLGRELGEGATEKARHFMTRIREGGARMGELIDDLLKLSRVARQEVRRIDVDLAAVARGIAQRLRTEEPSRDVEIVIPEKLTARCDLGLMSVVMENLLSNAWKYTGKTGQARIEIGSSRQVDGTSVYFVQDNGAGFDSNKATNLFTPFQRLHSPAEFPGNGVGLATVQRIIHRHGGRVWAEAEVGRGARFAFTCPHSEIGAS
jgi:signal transduction histidine kinase